MPAPLRRALGVFLFLLTLAAGILVGRSSVPAKTTHNSAPPESSPPTGSSVFSGPARFDDFVPLGYPHTEAGAKAAAANYTVVLGSRKILTPQDRQDVVRMLAAPGSDAKLTSYLADAGGSQLLASVRRDGQANRTAAFQTFPLSIRIAGTYRPAGVRVEVFAATIIASTEATASVGYGTASAQLVWAGGDWKIQGFSNTPTIGPVPVGYYTPSMGWQPSNGQSLTEVSDSVRHLLDGSPPRYVVR